MKILIDEQLPTKLRYRFNDAPYEIYTVRDMGWLGKKNGELLKLMADNNFDILLTNDKNLYYQQRISTLSLSIVNINTMTNRYDNILQILGLIKAKLKDIEADVQDKQVGNYYIVDNNEI